ncbi:MAG: hypothetical protein HYY10_02790 [Candidatus Liptonbacteria bacterium]|nr:hypothetical protein [Candidatus Liptonbacteria bacterium]
MFVVIESEGSRVQSTRLQSGDWAVFEINKKVMSLERRGTKVCDNGTISGDMPGDTIFQANLEMGDNGRVVARNPEREIIFCDRFTNAGALDIAFVMASAAGLVTVIDNCPPNNATSQRIAFYFFTLEEAERYKVKGIGKW